MVKLRKGDWIQIIMPSRTVVALVSQTRYGQDKVWIWYYDEGSNQMRNQLIDPVGMATKVTAGTVTITKLPKAVAKMMRPHQWNTERQYL